MSIWTADELTTIIAAYKAALLDLATAKTATIKTTSMERTVDRSDAGEIQRQLDYFKKELAEINGTVNDNDKLHFNIGRLAR